LQGQGRDPQAQIFIRCAANDGYEPISTNAALETKGDDAT
jgi:hypothetical protein